MTVCSESPVVRSDVIAAVCLTTGHNISVHLNSSSKRPGSPLSCCLCFTKHVLAKKIATASAVKLSTPSIDRNFSYSALISSFIPTAISFSARARYSESLSIPNSSKLLISQNLVKKLWYSSNIRSFAYSRKKKPTMIGSLYSICALASSTSYNELFIWTIFVNRLLLLALCVFWSLRYFVTVCRLRSQFSSHSNC